MDRRVYLVEPTKQLVALLSFDPYHPLREVAAIVAPELNFHLHYEGWRKAWESKAKATFVEGVVADWCDSPPVFLLVTDLQARSHAEAFDSWWTIREIHHLSIDESWRPS
jgi:hypothetical protein